MLATFAIAARDDESINNTNSADMDKTKDIPTAIKSLEEFDADMDATIAESDRSFLDIKLSDDMQNGELFATNDEDTDDD